ncbi:MAG: hypothetical protein ACRDLM_06190 [Gaiellaceae bacterium]
MPKQLRGRWRGALAASFVACAAAVAVTAGIARAQSPTPAWPMEDSTPGQSYPAGAKAVVVEGLGSLGCTYSQSSIESWTVQWIHEDQSVVTEISPQSYCGSVSQYESLINGIKNYVENYASYAYEFWGGFMLDEEPGFDFSASQLETLNSYVSNDMEGTPGVSWYFEEDQPNGWSQGTYYDILGDSWQAPQAYSDSMVSAINGVCSTYGDGYCVNNVTIDTHFSSPWNSPSYVTGLVHGTPWSNSYWGNGYWYNLWR